MRLRVAGVRFRLLPVLLLAGCDDCGPKPPPPSLTYLAIVPNELDVLVKNPASAPAARIVALVYDQYGRLIPDAPLVVATQGDGGRLALVTIGADKDTIVLRVQGAATTPFDAKLSVTHPASGVSVAMPIRVRYDLSEPHGAQAEPGSDGWPMIALASGPLGGSWQSHILRPFIQRGEFGKFESATEDLPPVGDRPSGTVLSNTYGAWRVVDAWSTTPSDVTVPTDGTAKPATIPVVPFFAADPSPAVEAQFLSDLYGGADIIGFTLTGVVVDVGTTVTKTSSTTDWADCGTWGTWLQGLPATQQPATGRLAFYMVNRNGTEAGTRGMHCGPGMLATSGALKDVHAIFLPAGPADAATVAHEIGHALLGGDHVSMGAGFFDDNLMVETDEVSAVLRSRFTVGQAFRAALDSRSWLASAGVTPSASLPCADKPPQCPALGRDAMVRTP